MKMKNLLLAISLLLLGLAMESCNANSDNPFIGVWGVERIEYFDTDYNGNLIEETIEIYNFQVGGSLGIDLCFKEDKSGYMDDRDQDTIKYFTYSYDEDASILYMNMKNDATTYSMYIESLTKQELVYINEFNNNRFEKTYMKWIDDSAKAASKNTKLVRPNKPGSLFGSK
jgi:hypothetical protein